MNSAASTPIAASLARDYVGELGHRVADKRWYFVRNVVAILGGTHSPEALPYLERTLRHGDHRVRRETIRAAAGIRDARSDEMLVAALGDDDAGNVQLAARYLGMLRIAKAAPTLEQVARAEGRGNRENGPRIEAMEALGRIGAPSSRPVLEELARQRAGFPAANEPRWRDRACAGLISADRGPGCCAPCIGWSDCWRSTSSPARRCPSICAELVQACQPAETASQSHTGCDPGT